MNGSSQVFSLEEGLYHEYAASLPVMLAERAESVLILGGGDGLAARNVLRFSDAKQVTLVELDATMIRLWSNRAELRRMNEDALRDRRLDLIVDDAVRWLLQTTKTFDVIICDIEMEHTRQPSKNTLLHYYRFFQAMGEKLASGGVWSTTVADDDDTDMLDGLVEFGSELLTRAQLQKYRKLRGPIQKSRWILKSLYPWVKECSMEFPVLGGHTTFYVSKDERKRLLRKPQRSLSHVSGDRPFSK